MTRRFSLLLALAVALLGGAVAAEAGGGKRGWGKPGVSVGVYVGPRYWGPRPWWGPGWYGFRPWPYAYPYAYPYSYAYPYPGYPPPVVVQGEPSVYIQQAPAAAQAAPSPEGGPPAPQAQYWYYCEDARAYYPYVQQCPRGWMTVVPPAPPR